MKYLDSFVKEYKESYEKKAQSFDNSIGGKIKRIQSSLLDDKFLPSASLKNLFDKLLRRSKYPMEVAITGQFSSGKSTFLNALLSKNILPMGITPVTSKVNFINYGEEYKLRVTYNNGAQQYHNIEDIAAFTDQRKEELDDVKYLSIYAPVEMLKYISFVDTPGLNSQSLTDTQTTQKILRDVDGIIWLSLIDNAGKESEAQILKEYMHNVKEKSLCVLNQKDKFTKEQVETTQRYVTSKFCDFFQRVIPISAMQALESRVQQKEVLLKDMIHLLVKDFKDDLYQNTHSRGLEFFKQRFEDYEKEKEKIISKDRSENIEEMKDSNIQEVLDYIEEVIRPAAVESKTYALEQELISICDILIAEYRTMEGVYTSLETILSSAESEMLEAYSEIEEKRKSELSLIYEHVQEILQEVAHEIFVHIKRKKKNRYEEVPGSLLRSKKIQRYEYEIFWIDSEALYQNLFYDEQKIDKKFVKIAEEIKKTELRIEDSFRSVYELLESSVHAWQESYELINKHREIASDLEFANIRNYASKVYENILISYRRAIEGNIVALNKKFSYLNGALGFSYKQLIHGCILHFEERFSKQIQSYEKDPRNISLSMPHEEDIYTRLESEFSFEKIETYLNSRRSYLHKIVAYAKDEYIDINDEKIEYIRKDKALFGDKMEAIKTIKQSI